MIIDLPLIHEFLTPVSPLYSGFTPTIYAAPADLGSGNGSSEANAMDVLTAMTLLGPGDVLGLVPGNFSSPAISSDRFQPVFAPASSGTVGSPIRICAKYPAVYLSEPSTDPNRSEFSITGTSVPPFPGGVDTSVTLGAREGTDHIHWYGIYSDQITAVPWPSGGTWGVSSGCNGIRFEQCVGDMNVWDHQDNYPLIFATNADGLIVNNCRFRFGADDFAIGGQMPVMTFYGVTNFRISHCDFIQTNAGVFLKGDFNGVIRNHGVVEYCKFKGVLTSCFLVNVATVAPGNLPTLRFCLATDCGIFVDVDDAGGNDPSIKRFSAYNNTFVNPTPFPGGGAFFPTFLRNQQWAISEAEFFNNICANFNSDAETPYFLNPCGHLADNSTLDVTGFTTLNFNDYYRGAGTSRWATNGVTVTSLAAWQAAVQAETPGQEANSIAANPQFTNMAGEDYTLAPGSPCLGTGQGGVNMGCYLTGDEEIGVEAQ